ncbi:MAG: helicase, partial [Candidatus Desulforudis sp.]|nr:helicase [Desulforudis sp.]
RFFPNQDTRPRGGFGNLIALPLQREPRTRGNSVFLNEAMDPFEDQWLFLSRLRRMAPVEVESIVRQAERNGDVIRVRVSLSQEEEDPWTLTPSGRKTEKPVPGLFPQQVRLVRGNQVYIEKEGIPSAMISSLTRIAAFQNPEFYRAQAMRLSTFGKPRVIGCAEDFPRHLGLPRGCLDEAVALLEAHNVAVEVVDERFPGQPIDVSFRGQLSRDQKVAAEALTAHDEGVLSATTAFGKTVVAAWLIAARRVNTLVLVHRRQLMDQWRERLALFLTTC